ncbi:hypothetical protein, partial [uncultured Cohaesibacter sp.]|uniref:hypothetical protein n=1 Tax=uncultured Cohaesibacter sp. TaxID=1002546 RepID=UPI00292F515A
SVLQALISLRFIDFAEFRIIVMTHEIIRGSDTRLVNITLVFAHDASPEFAKTNFLEDEERGGF